MFWEFGNKELCNQDRVGCQLDKCWVSILSWIVEEFVGGNMMMKVGLEQPIIGFIFLIWRIGELLA